jgi:hypothetical protein
LDTLINVSPDWVEDLLAPEEPKYARFQSETPRLRDLQRLSHNGADDAIQPDLSGRELSVAAKVVRRAQDLRREGGHVDAVFVESAPPSDDASR